MSKTAPIPDDVHALIVDKQIELKRKHKVTVKISDIIAIVMKNNIHKLGKYLGFTNDEKSDILEENVKQDLAKQDIAKQDIAKQDIVLENPNVKVNPNMKVSIEEK